MAAVSRPMMGKTCVVTGATSGIGAATAEALAAMGARVIVVGRNPAKCEATVRGITERTGNRSVECLVADLSSQREVRRLAQEILARCPRLDVLVNDAGAIYSKRMESVDGIELTFALNHLAPFLLTNLLFDRLVASAPARVVTVTSGLHRQAAIRFDDLEGRKRYSGMRAYGQSKLANVLFTYELARRFDGTGVTATTLSPGMVATNFGMNNPGLMRAGVRIGNRLVGRTPAQGARTVIYLASSPEVAGVTGQHFEDERAVPSSNASHDEEAARRLWEISAKMTELPESAGLPAGNR